MYQNPPSRPRGKLLIFRLPNREQKRFPVQKIFHKLESRYSARGKQMTSAVEFGGDFGAAPG